MGHVSGYPFQEEVENRFKAFGFKTITDQSYRDDSEEKSRSIDLIAIQECQTRNSGELQLSLVVETKYLTGDVTVRLRENPKNYEAYFIDRFYPTDLELHLKGFHFLEQKDVTFSIEEGSDKKRNLFAAVNQSMKALQYLRMRQLLNRGGLFYPLVVYKGANIVDQRGLTISNVLYYQTTEWRDPGTDAILSRALYVDIIHETNLEAYLDMYKKEMDRLLNMVRFYERMQQKKVEQNRQSRLDDLY